MRILVSTIACLFFFSPASELWGDSEIGRLPTPSEPSGSASKKINRYAQRLIDRYDTDGNGLLTPTEWKAMQGRPAVIDRNQDEQITGSELVQHIQEYAHYRRLGGASHSSLESSFNPSGAVDTQDPSAAAQKATAEKGVSLADPYSRAVDQSPQANGPIPAPFHVPLKQGARNHPDWFTQRDRNGDGQLSLAEFAPAHARQSVQAFQQLDRNRDGLMTPEEASRKSPSSEKKQQ